MLIITGEQNSHIRVSNKEVSLCHELALYLQYEINMPHLPLISCHHFSFLFGGIVTRRQGKAHRKRSRTHG